MTRTPDLLFCMNDNANEKAVLAKVRKISGIFKVAAMDKTGKSVILKGFYEVTLKRNADSGEIMDNIRKVDGIDFVEPNRTNYTQTPKP